MNWDRFIDGRISVYCRDRSEANQFLDECEAHGLQVEFQRERSERYTMFAYRCDNGRLMLYPCEDENEWNGQLGFGNVTEALRYSEIHSKVKINTLDELL